MVCRSIFYNFHRLHMFNAKTQQFINVCNKTVQVSFAYRQVKYTAVTLNQSTELNATEKNRYKIRYGPPPSIPYSQVQLQICHAKVICQAADYVKPL